MNRRKKIIVIAIILFCCMLAATILAIRMTTQPAIQQSKAEPKSITIPTPQPTTTPEVIEEDYKGQEVTVGNGFKVIVPNAWRASVSTQTSFLGIQFARPGQLESLVYNEAVQSVIDYDGIPSWGGLTEHFYIRQITSPSQAFNPADHAEVTSESFTFKDGTIGTKYSVTKHATEAQKYGGLLKDSEWYGRVFVYTKGDATIEAHLAYYPSTKIEPDFYEKVAGSIKIGE